METEQAADPVVLALTGQLPTIIILAAILAYPLSLLLLWLYKRAVLEFMSKHASSVVQSESLTRSPTPSPSSPLPSLEFVTLSTDVQSTQNDDSTLNKLITRRLWYATTVYSVAGVLFVLLMSFAWLVASSIEFSFFRCLMVFWTMAWPIVLTINLIAASTRRVLIVSTGLYFAVYLLLSAIALIRSPDFTANQISLLWLTFNLMPTALLLFFLNRQIRSVGPLILVFMIVGLTGSVVATSVIGQNEAALHLLIEITSLLGLGDHAFASIIMAGFACFAVLGWLLAIWIRRGYDSKILSDQAILLDSVWIIFGITHAVSLVFEGWQWLMSFFFAFLVYKVVVLIGFRLIPTSPNNSNFLNKKLLLLRVFKLGKRSERVFDGITKHWRFVGNVQLIAGPDLAATTIEPHEFLEFLRGRLTRLFIHEKNAFDERMNSIDTQPDFDGRFRINDFFCYENTWEMVISRLVKESDVILMDLRSFSPERRGCIRELNELIHGVPVERVILLIDENTDNPFLEQTIRQCWSAMPTTSPNANGPSKILRLFRLNSHQAIPTSALINELCISATHPADSILNSLYHGA